MAVSSTLSSSDLRPARATSAQPHLFDALREAARPERRWTLPCTLQATLREDRVTLRGRLNAHSPPNLPIFAGRVPVADRRGLIRKYATPVWKYGRRLGTALGRLQSIKGRPFNPSNHHSTVFLLFVYSPSPHTPFAEVLHRVYRGDLTSPATPCSSGDDGLSFRHRLNVSDLALGHHVDHRDSRPFFCVSPLSAATSRSAYSP
ncbi:hypothetical protein K525DRAFT_291262 [Schizophyllum commune Loenen D]|nr:hypothetical protein K525DRAFT_291262 [Schizophyllum commune Loenen D]